MERPISQPRHVDSLPTTPLHERYLNTKPAILNRNNPQPIFDFRADEFIRDSRKDMLEVAVGLTILNTALGGDERLTALSLLASAIAGIDVVRNYEGPSIFDYPYIFPRSSG